MLDEMLLIFGKFLPVFCVLSEVYFVYSPETSHLIFVHFPDVFVDYGQNYKAVRILFK